MLTKMFQNKLLSTALVDLLFMGHDVTVKGFAPDGWRAGEIERLGLVGNYAYCYIHISDLVVFADHCTPDRDFVSINGLPVEDNEERSEEGEELRALLISVIHNAYDAAHMAQL